ncbi:hypothetical protein K3495_g11690 [Podosphaera aphanis]|nr:hypothetical protein K3495_g11690 [Podosphaera aphanis]
MFRKSLITSACRAIQISASRSHSIARLPRQISFVPIPKRSSVASQTCRWYSATPTLSELEVQGRIIDLLKNFDKVAQLDKISPTAHFYNDLGLDSLDTVEVVMAIEEEFSLEIPDKDADAIHSVDQAVKYILAQPDAH